MIRRTKIRTARIRKRKDKQIKEKEEKEERDGRKRRKSRRAEDPSDEKNIFSDPLTHKCRGKDKASFELVLQKSYPKSDEISHLRS
ncbi:MAG TPA: hypothetical protein VHA52_05465 [Candidatus Babeliaceae bacterium]|nr:hypothetical protein [Candidatus Babeliaceae bacterium]